MDHSSSCHERALKKYDFNTEAIGTVAAVATIGIPLFDIL
jgi:hypothetical protein